VAVVAGGSGEAAFGVEAAAALAAPVTWKVAVTTSQPTGPIDPGGRYLIDSHFDLVAARAARRGQPHSST
jgi:hypothetical protein